MGCESAQAGGIDVGEMDAVDQDPEGSVAIESGKTGFEVSAAVLIDAGWKNQLVDVVATGEDVRVGPIYLRSGLPDFESVE